MCLKLCSKFRTCVIWARTSKSYIQFDLSSGQAEFSSRECLTTEMVKKNLWIKTHLPISVDSSDMLLLLRLSLLSDAILYRLSGMRGRSLNDRSTSVKPYERAAWLGVFFLTSEVVSQKVGVMGLEVEWGLGGGVPMSTHTLNSGIA